MKKQSLSAGERDQEAQLEDIRSPNISSDQSSIIQTIDLSDRKGYLFYSLLTFISAWVGAKVLFIMSVPASMKFISHQFNFWTGGGFVFYGGLIFSIFSSLIWLKFSPIRISLSPVIPALCLGHAIGRVGCFLTGCCFGRIINHTEVPVQLIERIRFY